MEADSVSIKYLETNCKNNCNNNVELFFKAIYNVSGELINFGNNQFLNGSSLNDSTSQIYIPTEKIEEIGGYQIETISIFYATYTCASSLHFFK